MKIILNPLTNRTSQQKALKAQTVNIDKINYS